MDSDNDNFALESMVRTFEAAGGVIITNSLAEAFPAEDVEHEARGKNSPGIILILATLMAPLGLAALKAALGQTKNLVGSLVRSAMRFCIGLLGFWIVGGAVALGDGNAFLGLSDFAWVTIPSNQWLLQMSLSVYCVSLVTCGGLERSSILADYVVTLTVSIVIFPIVVHWCWHHQGWLAQLSYQDQAGAGVIHVVSGTMCLVLASLCGPREPDFVLEMSSRLGLQKSGHNPFLAALGAAVALAGTLFIQVALVAARPEITFLRHIVTNSLLGLTGGGLVAFHLSWCKTHQWSLYRILFGMMAGLVGVSGGVGHILAWQSLLLGSLAGSAYVLGRNVISGVLGVDDALEVGAINVLPGFLGLVLSPLIHPRGVIYASVAGSSGLLRKAVNELVMSFMGGVVLILWAAVPCWIVFKLLDICKVLKYDGDEQLAGDDTTRMREELIINCGCAHSQESYKTNQTSTSFFPFVQPNTGKQSNGNRSFLQSQPMAASTSKDLDIPRLVWELPGNADPQPKTPSRVPPSFEESRLEPPASQVRECAVDVGNLEQRVDTARQRKKNRAPVPPKVAAAEKSPRNSGLELPVVIISPELRNTLDNLEDKRKARTLDGKLKSLTDLKNNELLQTGCQLSEPNTFILATG